MSLTLYFHPLSSYCHKALIALYENGTPFEQRIVDLMNPADAAAFKRLWPCGQFPVLRDEAKDLTIPESSVIIEYLDQHYPGKTKFIPADPGHALQVRLKDRFMIFTCTSTCRRWSATGCARMARKTRMVSSRRGRASILLWT
jgi:glutathione S-transferase